MNSKEIYQKLSINPLTISVTTFGESSFLPKNDWSSNKKINHFITSTTVDTEIINITTEENEGKKYTFPTPKLSPEQTKIDQLTEEQELRLYYQFRMAKSALHEFKNLMRAAGVDVSNFDITITNNRLNLSKIPDDYRSIFEIIYKNHLSAQSFKARGTHKLFHHPFMRELKNTHTAAKSNKDPLNNNHVSRHYPTPFQR